MNFVKSVFILCAIFIFAGCSDNSGDKENFINAYKDILITRVKYPDTLEANPHVLKIYKKYGFTQQTFKQMYFELADSPQDFLIILDSARERARRELVETKDEK